MENNQRTLSRGGFKKIIIKKNFEINNFDKDIIFLIQYYDIV